METPSRIYLYEKSKTIILDLGSKYTKIGFSTESSPRFILPTVFNNIYILDPKYVDDIYENLAKFLTYLYFSKLLLNPRETKVVVVESLLVPLIVKQNLGKVLFKHLHVSGVIFAPNASLTLYTVAAPSALTIDIGYNETTIVPVWEGFPILHALKTFPTGGRAIETELRSLLEIYYRDELKEDLPEISDWVLEDIKVRLCFVAPLQREKKKPPLVTYPMAKKKFLKVAGIVRQNAAECVFMPNDDYKTLSATILDSILQCPIDTRRHFLSKLLICGGTSNMLGFKSRLADELKQLLASEKKYETLNGEIKMFKPPCQANYTAWLGGYLLSQGDFLKTRCITETDYAKLEDIPDWANLRFNQPFKPQPAA